MFHNICEGNSDDYTYTKISQNKCRYESELTTSNQNYTVNFVLRVLYIIIIWLNLNPYLL